MRIGDRRGRWPVWPVWAVVLAGLVSSAAGAQNLDAGADTVRPEPPKDLGRTHEVRLVYFVPTDRKPARNYREKIVVLMTFVNDLYTRDLRAKGYPVRGLDFEFKAGKPVVHLVKGKTKASHYNDEPDFDSAKQWDRILPEVEAALGPAAENLYVIFAETYDDGPTEYEWRGGFARGGRASAVGGVGMFSAWILQDPFCATTIDEQLRLFADATPVKGRVANHFRRPDSPRFEFIEGGFEILVYITDRGGNMRILKTTIQVE